MKRVTYLLLCLSALLTKCKSVSGVHPGDRFVSKFQFYLVAQKRLITMEDSTNIYYGKTVTVYEEPYEYISVKETADKKSGIITIDTLRHEVRYSYLAFDKSDKLGFWFDSLKVKNYEKVNLDSINNKYFIKEFKIYSPEYTLTAAARDEKTGTLIEKYICKVKPDESYFDTAIYYYKNKSNLTYSLAPDSEKVKKAKLVKAIYIYNPSFNKAISDSVPRREFKIELKEIGENENAKNIMKRYLAIKAGKKPK